MKFLTNKKCEIANKILQELNRIEVDSNSDLKITVVFIKKDGKIKEIKIEQ